MHDRVGACRCPTSPAENRPPDDGLGDPTCERKRMRFYAAFNSFGAKRRTPFLRTIRLQADTFGYETHTRVTTRYCVSKTYGLLPDILNTYIVPRALNDAGQGFENFI